MENMENGDLKERLEMAARRLGYGCLWGLVKACPGVPYRDLATSLNADVVAIQVEQLVRDEALARGALAFLAKDCFLRFFRRHLPKGWKAGPRGDFKTARVYSSWCGALGDDLVGDARKVWCALSTDPEVKKGWSPSGIEDRILTRAFEGVGFHSDCPARTVRTEEPGSRGP